MQIVDDRRALHSIPELDRDLPRTMEYLRASLNSLGCRVFSPMEGALAAWFDFGREKAVAFRSDMDALPIREQTGLPFASRHEGKMHACGHDGHMAMLLELARRLDKKADCPHNVLLVFQPAEETTGGARDLCETGIFEEYQVEAIFGIHLWPGLTDGTVASRKKEMMSRSCEVKAEIIGRSAHIAKAGEGLDAMEAGVLFYSRVREMERSLPKDSFRVLNFGRMESGSVCNAVSGRTVLEGTLRAFRDDVFFALQDGIREVGRQVEARTGCAVKIAMSEGYPAVWNPEDLYDRVQRVAYFQELEEPSLITEDFSWYQRYLPGMFFFLGTGDSPALHNDRFDFDESILIQGADFLERLAENYR